MPESEMGPASANSNASEQNGDAGLKKRTVESIKYVLVVLGIMTLLKGTIAEARFIPSGSMEPNLNIQDRVLVEKLDGVLGRDVQRGDILVFYPPPIETGVPDNGLLGRYIPFVPENPPAFIKRVIGLPGDVIKIEHGVGVLVNDQLLKIDGATTPEYDLSNLGDIQGYNMRGKWIRPYGASTKEIVVPPNSFFMMGDNRNASADSHVWGFVSKDRVVGRACLVFWKQEWLRSLLNHQG
ncbi:MAG: signal peptidase I [Candidatus Obscuribacterales bacterium]|nr:signal peptidase I [Cyanobacteria bacterium SZAS LIN-5]RTL41416.1 MAG: signal peptidase I [Candidatus Melainabacteria bacterium]